MGPQSKADFRKALSGPAYITNCLQKPNKWVVLDGVVKTIRTHLMFSLSAMKGGYRVSLKRRECMKCHQPAISSFFSYLAEILMPNLIL